MRGSLLMLAGVVAALLLGGCGDTGTGTTRSGDETQAAAEAAKESRPPLRKIHITLDGQPSPENVGILMADSRGYFDDVGLQVEFSPPEKPFRPIEYVEVGIVEMGISHLPQVVLAQGEDLPIVAIGSLVSQPTAAMIWLRGSKIGGLADLKGKTIAIPGVPFQEGLLESLLARAGLTVDDVKLERVDYDLVPALVSGRADAIFGGSGNVEGVELESRGLEPVITPVSDLGVPPYDELVVITRRGLLARDPEAIRNFMAAVARGTQAAIEDPEAAVKAITGSSFEAGKAASNEVEATLPLLSETSRMSTEEAEELVEWMRDQGLIQQEVAVSALLTNRYLKQ